MNFIYFTNRFKEQISGATNEQSIFDRVQKLEECDDIKNLNSIDRYRGDVFVYKLFKAYTSRILISLEKIKVKNEDVNFYFVLEYVPKKLFAYKWGNVIHPKLVDGTWLNENNISEQEKEVAIEKFTSLRKSEDAEKPPLTANLTNWLAKFNASPNIDVLEYEDWTNYASNPTASGLEDKYLLVFKNLLSDILSEEPNNNSFIEIKPSLYFVTNENKEVGILYSKHKFSELSQPLFVIRAGTNLHKQKENKDKILTNAESIEVEKENSLEILTKNSFRAYPKWILRDYDYNLWELIQRHDKDNYNLSLLPEQIDFLKNFRFPTYINGQAGSGKSTMLYYLFANVFSNKIAGEFFGEIIFLTENELLIEQTKNTIIGLLNSNPDFHFDLTLEKQNLVKSSFKTFLDFLLELLNEAELTEFPRTKYMDFSKFKTLYYRNYQSKYSAEIVWFVINTYVLGYDENEIIDTKEKYLSKVVRDFQIISGNLFEEILRESYSFFKKLIEEEKYWTKTTLARRIHKIYPKKLPKQYVAVFCDEAQDFTRIELRLIIFSSEYMNYNLSNEDQIPIVFAGDALQTVSPNRFTLTRLKQMYYSIFEESNYDYSKERQERSIYTPSYNYRSIESIVKIANIVQQYRLKYLEEDMYKKQVSKRTSQGSIRPTLHYREWITSSGIFEQFKTKFKYKTFIIPSDVNEEQDFIKQNADLIPSYKEINGDNEETLRSDFVDIKSSINAKGAEYGDVVVLGFGDYYLSNFKKLDPKIIDQDNNYKHKFFFNKLYVAITRAQNELTIIDSEESVVKFWRPLFESVKGLPDAWESIEELGDLVHINPRSLSTAKTTTKEDALVNAHKDKEQGLLDKNPIRLKLAANIFQILNANNEAYDCYAYSYLLQQNWTKAGDNFLKAEKLENASDAYFKGKSWDKIPRVVQGNLHQIRLLISNLMKNDIWDNSEIGLMYDLRNQFHEVLKDITWYSELSKQLSVFVKTVNSVSQRRDLAYILESLIREDDNTLWSATADLYYSSNQLEKAIESWEKYIFANESIIYPVKYIEAKIQLAKNQNIKEEILIWSGKLLTETRKIEKTTSKKLAQDIIDLFNSLNFDSNSSENKPEILEHYFAALVSLGISSSIHEIASSLEKSISSYDQIRILYEKILSLVEDESLSIFLKERWVYYKFKQLKSETKSKDISSIVNELNYSFEICNFPFPKSNFSWSKEEIQSISEIPEPISNNPPSHLSEVGLINFRKFKELRLSNIGKYNIILGDNNTGKTSLLEALLFSPDPNEELKFLLYTKINRLNSFSDDIKELLEEIKTSGVENTENIKYSLSKGRHTWSYSLQTPSFEDLFKKTKDRDAVPNNYLLIKRENSNSEIQFSENIKNLNLSPQNLKNVPFVPYGRGYSIELSELYYELIGSKDPTTRNNFISLLKSFIPNIHSIQIRPHDNCILVEEKDLKGNFTSTPLYSFGDGAKKLFRILIQLYSAKGNKLMIDEIDAGIHYSRFRAFWEIILKSAKSLNVQLFVSTHNDECIKYFYSVLLKEEFKSYRPETRLITLEYISDENRVIPITRDFDSLDYALIHDLETRGGNE